MARLKVIDSFRGPPCAFLVEMLDGTLSAGDVLPLWETHHRANFTVTSTDGPAKSLRITVDELIPWDHMWKGAIVDTEDPSVSRKYGYST